MNAKSKAGRSECQRIENLMQRAFEGDAFHGPAVRELFAGVTPTQAAARPLLRGHSIWEIACHMATWQRYIRRRLEEGKTVEPADEENFPTLQDFSEKAWQAVLEDLEEGQRSLRKTILGLRESDLDKPVSARSYDVYVMLHGIIQHDLYHAGQIALLKKSFER